MTRLQTGVEAAPAMSPEQAEDESVVALRIRGAGASWTIPLDLPVGIYKAVFRQLERTPSNPRNAFRERIKPGLARVLVAQLDEDLLPPSQHELHQAARTAVAHNVALPAAALAHRGALREFVQALKAPK